MNENEIASQVVDTCVKIHMRLGPGLFENVYKMILAYELEKRGLVAEKEVKVPVFYDGLVFDQGFFADIIVNDKVIIELKSLEDTAPVHKKQLLTYLKLTGLKLGLLINFGAPLMKDGITRLANGL